jgi:prepilin-type N-terminal cleavage/methylation domain-containing protein
MKINVRYQKGHILKRKVKAVTLTEVLVAMSLLGLILTFSMILSDRVMAESPKLHMISAQNIIDETIHKIKNEQKYIDFDDQVSEHTGVFNVKVVFNKSSISTRLVEVALEVYEPKSSSSILTEHILLKTSDNK